MILRLVQCLCPSRHCIIAIPYEPGLSSAQWDASSDITLTEANAADYVQRIVARMIESGAINPWCGICKARIETWRYEDALTKFRTYEAAAAGLAKAQEANRIARALLGQSGQN